MVLSLDTFISPVARATGFLLAKLSLSILTSMIVLPYYIWKVNQIYAVQILLRSVHRL